MRGAFKKLIHQCFSAPFTSLVPRVSHNGYISPTLLYSPKLATCSLAEIEMSSILFLMRTMADFKPSSWIQANRQNGRITSINFGESTRLKSTLAFDKTANILQ